MEILSGLGAIGLTYHSCPYWKRRLSKPTVHISLWWVKLIIHLPIKHLTPKGHGSATSSYGIFWWPSLRMKPSIFWHTIDKTK
jgi:hypothetical protein